MDAAAFDRALTEARPVMLRIAKLQLRNDTLAEDVVSDTLINLPFWVRPFLSPTATSSPGGTDLSPSHEPLIGSVVT